MAGQDIRKRLAPGGAQPINVSGDYIYMKFADRPVNVIINGGRSGQTRVTMEAGDKYRPGPFGQFEIENPDTERPAQIIITVGEGDYNRQYVKGEIQAEPILRNADGTTKPDTRFTLEMDLYPSRLSVISYQQFDLIQSINVSEAAEQGGKYFQGVYKGHAFRVGDNLGVAVTNNATADGEVLIYDTALNLIQTVNVQLDYGKNDSGHHPGFGYLTVEASDPAAIKTVSIGNYQTGAEIFRDENEIASFCWVPMNGNILVYNNETGAQK